MRTPSMAPFEHRITAPNTLSLDLRLEISQLRDRSIWRGNTMKMAARPQESPYCQFYLWTIYLVEGFRVDVPICSVSRARPDAIAAQAGICAETRARHLTAPMGTLEPQNPKLLSRSTVTENEVPFVCYTCIARYACWQFDFRDRSKSAWRGWPGAPAAPKPTMSAKRSSNT